MRVFNNPIQTSETYTAQGAIMLWSGAGVAEHLPLLIQALSVTYGRNVSPIHPVNTSVNGTVHTVNIAGPAQGSLTVQGVLTPDTKGLVDFIKAAGKPCRKTGDEITLNIQPFSGSCKTDANGTVSTLNIKYILKGIELQSMALNIQGGLVSLISQPLTFTFDTLEIVDL